MKKMNLITQRTGSFAIRMKVLAIVMLAAISNVWSQQTVVSTSQEEEIPKYRWGAKGGFNSASEHNDDGSTNARTGLHLGIFVESTISNKVDIQPELVYSMQGGVDKNNVTEKFDYINIPVIFKIYVNQSRTFSIDVGPQLGYMISAKYTYKGSTTDIYDYSSLNKIDAAVCAGVSYKFNQKFHATFRFNYSVTKIADSSDNVNGVGQLSLGYFF